MSLSFIMSSPDSLETFYYLPASVYSSISNRDGRLSSQTDEKWIYTVQADTEKRAKQKPRAVFVKVSEGKDQFVCLLISNQSQTNNYIMYIKNKQQKKNNTIKNWTKNLNRHLFLQRSYTDSQQTLEKMFNITNH